MQHVTYCMLLCDKMASINVDLNNDNDRKRRKRGVMHEEDYKRSKIQKAKLMGKQHIGHTGRRVAEKSIGPDCR